MTPCRGEGVQKVNMTKPLKKVLIMTGGTGGHVFPGLAVANHLAAQGIQVAWVGTARGLEAKLVPAAGIPLHLISISGLRGKGWKDIVLFPWRLFIAIFQSIRIIRQYQPDVILGMGGFVSGPGGIASWLLGYPLIIHEQNARAGTTNRWLSRVAKKVLEGFPHTFSPRKNLVTIGNPVREVLMQLPAPEQRLNRPHAPLHLLVLGGSLGAQAINQLLPQALAKMPPAERPMVLHQTGEKHAESTQKAYTLADVSAEVVPFIDKMEQAYAWADVVVCRSGALTIAELCAVGLGAILVPFPHAIDDHQTANANYLVKQGAAWLVQQNTLTADGLAALLNKLSSSAEQRLLMAKAAYQLRQTDVAEKVLQICEEICH